MDAVIIIGVTNYLFHSTFSESTFLDKMKMFPQADYFKVFLRVLKYFFLSLPCCRVFISGSKQWH